MDLDRRKLLAGMVGTGVSSLLPVVPKVGSETSGSPTRWHPLTRSLLDRAAIAPTRPDVHGITRVVHELSDAQGLASPPVIKWLETPSDAFDHLSHRGLTALLDMGESTFWRASRKPLRVDEDDAERMIELRELAAAMMMVDECDRLLMEPKLAFRNKAITASGASPEAIFQARAVAAQIGWLETSLAAVAVQAILLVELAFRRDDRAPDNDRLQLAAFEAWEAGLLATWETSSELVCVPRVVWALVRTRPAFWRLIEFASARLQIQIPSNLF